MLLYGLLVLFASNMGAVVDRVFHPAIPYFHPEHAIVGGITGIVTIALLAGLETYLARRRRSEAALRTSEARFRTLVEEAGDGFALLDAEGRYLDVNGACCRQLGYSREELLRLSIAETDQLFSPARFTADFQSLVDKPPVTYRSEHRRKDGTTFPVEVTLSIVRIGGVPQALSLARDVSERQRTLDALKLDAAILQNVSEGVYLVGLEDGIIKYANPRFERMFGYDRGEMIGMHVARLNAPGAKTPEDTGAGIVGAVRDAGEWHGEIENVKKDGTRFCGHANLSLFDHPTLGRVIVSIHTDVSARKRAEAALRESEETYRALFENMTQGAFRREADGTLLDVNPSALRMFGLTRDQVLGNPALTQVCGVVREDGSPFPELDLPCMQALATGRPVRGVVAGVLNQQTQERVWLEINAVPGFRPGEQTPYQVSVTLHDITERTQAQEAVRRERDRAQQFLDIAGTILLGLAADQIITLINRRGCEVLGHAQEELLGRNWFDLCVPERQRESLRAVFARLMSGEIEPSRYVENLVRTHASAERMIAWQNTLVRDAGGRIVGTLSSGEDITERKQVEAALRELARHLEAVREEEHTRIAREIHDELGQALTALRLDLTWVGRKLPKGSTALRRRIDGAVALTDETITVGQRIVGELRPPILDDLGLVPAVEWYAQRFARRSGLRIQLEVGAQEPVVPDHLAVTAYRIVQEALTNVARHAQATHVTVRLGGQDDALVLDIRDDGQGIRADAVQSPRSLGIVGMRERAASLGGTVLITGSPGAGTTVRVTFPLERRKERRTPQ